MSGQPILTLEPFQKWVFDFVGPFHPPSIGDFQYILVATNYYTKWVEEKDCTRSDDSSNHNKCSIKILSYFSATH